MSDLTECFLDDDGGQSSPVLAVEEQGPDGVTRQALWVRVGPVWYGDEIAGPVVWVDYQEQYMGSGTSGPVMLTPEVWHELVAAIDARLENFNLEGYKPKPRKKMTVEDYGATDIRGLPVEGNPDDPYRSS